MIRRRKDFSKFPTPEIPDARIIEDTRDAEYMSKFRDHHVRSVFYFALLGMTNAQMAVALGISSPCFSSWLKRHETFREAVEKGKEQADAKMVYSLYQAGVGYEVESEQIFMGREKIYGKDVNGKTVLLKEVPKVIRVPIVKKYPPDIKANLRWLEVRQPELWRVSKEINFKGTMKHELDLTDMSIEELKLLSKLGGRSNNVIDVPFETTEQKELKEVNWEENV